VASKLAVSTLIKLVLATPDWILRLDDDQLSQEVMRRAKVRLGQINTALVDVAQANPNLKGLGTTLTVAWNLGKDLIIAHVGDSCAYLYRKQQLHKLTHDHTMAQFLADQGFIAQREVAMSRFHHVLTKALGDTATKMEPDLVKLAIEDGDVLLLCTDGLTDMVSDELVSASLGCAIDAKETCKVLLEQALDAGGKDNVTVAVARYRFV
jgi:protein phosphatase